MGCSLVWDLSEGLKMPPACKQIRSMELSTCRTPALFFIAGRWLISHRQLKAKQQNTHKKSNIIFPIYLSLCVSILRYFKDKIYIVYCIYTVITVCVCVRTSRGGWKIILLTRLCSPSKGFYINRIRKQRGKKVKDKTNSYERWWKIQFARSLYILTKPPAPHRRRNFLRPAEAGRVSVEKIRHVQVAHRGKKTKEVNADQEGQCTSSIIEPCSKQF